MTIAEWLRSAAELLRASGSPDPEPDAGWILEWALGCEPSYLRTHRDALITKEALERADEKLRLRAGGEPLQYALGEAWFYGRRFASDRRALIPRQDTEVLCEAALECLRGIRAPRVWDLCTGTGIIGITVVLEHPGAVVRASDISADALALAEENACALGAEVCFLQGDLLEPMGDTRWDCILSNPPYLTESEMGSLQREVCAEPRLALAGGGDGLEFYRRILRGAPAHLLPGGCVLLEIGSAQSAAVEELARNAFAEAEIDTIRDLQGLDRVVRIRTKR